MYDDDDDASETCLAKVFLIWCFDAIFWNLFTGEAVCVTQGLFDP